MSGPRLANRIRRGFYLDSVALMRVSGRIAALPGVADAALMIGTEANKRVLENAGLLAAEGRGAGTNDLVIALRAENEPALTAALAEVERALEASAPTQGGGADGWRPKTVDSAIAALPGANLALISVPGAFAAVEARKALARGLNVMIFSDNVALEDERALKEAAAARGLLVMGPDCGTAYLGGVPLAFANAVPRGDVGVISASGTGLQELAVLLARGGKGISQGIGVGGRDLGDAVGGLTTLAAIDALEDDPGTRRIVLVSKPPGTATAAKVFARLAACAKPVTACLIGLERPALPDNVAFAATLKAAAETALAGAAVGAGFALEAAAGRAAARLGAERKWLRGLYCGGTLCAEAQVVLRAAGLTFRSNVPIPDVLIPGVPALNAAGSAGHVLIDLGADDHTLGRPHPMIEPAVRGATLRRVLAEPTVAVVLLDVVLGYGAHPDPAGAVVAVLLEALPDARSGAGGAAPLVVASVCGTERDPQGHAGQVARLERAGVVVAPCNAQAAELAARVLRARR